MTNNHSDLMTPLTIPELQHRIAIHERRIADALAPHDPVTATLAWFDTLRAIEECINLPHHAWSNQSILSALSTLPVMGILNQPAKLRQTRDILAIEFTEPFANRFAQLMMQAAAIGMSFDGHGFAHVSVGFMTVGSMIGYLMSRRRHMVAMLHALPFLCRGRIKVDPLDTLNLFLPAIEMDALLLVGAEQALLIKASAVRLKLQGDAAPDYALLDPMFLEPERSRITEMPTTEAGAAIFAGREPLATDRLFSAAELRNDILAVQAAYAEFDLSGTEFAAAADFVRRLSTDHIERDFWIAIRPLALAKLFDSCDAPQSLRRAVVHNEANFSACLSTYAPLVLVNGMYRTTVTLLSRFIYHWRAVSLDRNKRYQIRAGFIFEAAVADELGQQGFAVQAITRINRHEFDVVTVRDGIIWNVQCKNNFLDLERLEADPVRFAKYNVMLVRGYERALQKEREREDLLTVKLGTTRIEHMLVSRFPVVTDNPRMVPFSRIGQFLEIAENMRLLVRQSP